MKSKIFKILLLLTAGFAIHPAAFAQQKPITPDTATSSDFSLNLNDITAQISVNLSSVNKALNLTLNHIAPRIALKLKDLDKNINLNLNDIIPGVAVDLNVTGNGFDYNFGDTEPGMEKGEVKQKLKNYSKSYTLDANDRVKLNNQFGKITVITWDKHEVRVDVQIKAEANGDDEAQKLLDGVQIYDSKNGDVVSFKTEIQRSKGSWSIFNFGGRSAHKLEINYTVHMPAKTELDAEQSYGAIALPDMDGKVRISSSYSNVVAENLSNPSNEIEGSYGNLKIGALNGGALDFSYGNVDLAECTNLKANLSYGSLKLGKLRGYASLNLSYVDGLKIGEIAASLKKLNINSSYSGLSLGIPGNNNFDFDITVTNAGFNYNDDKVTITSKTPSDSRHYSPTKNYRGRFGKGSTDSKVTINSSYGSVHFE